MEEEILPELKPLIIRMLDNIKPRYVPLPQPVLHQIILFSSLAALLLLTIFISARIRSWAKRRRREKELHGNFSRILSEAEENLGIDIMYSENDGSPGTSSPGPICQGLAARCAALGEKVDGHTGRKDNSKRVAMLAYNISCSTKMTREQAALCFCCALVSEAGLLDLPGQLFFREILSAKERKQIRASVKGFTDYIGFIPRCYDEFFIGASLHQGENLDGSGYPDGLKGSEIPVLARIIRVAKDYTALTEPRSHGIFIPFTPKAAVRYMKRSKKLYDQRIVSILEKLI